MKRILFVASISQHIVAFHLSFIEDLQQAGYEVHVAAFVDQRSKDKTRGVIWHHIPFARSPFGYGNIISLFRLITLMKANRYTLVHVHTPVAAFLGRLAARLTKTPSVLYTAHGFHFYSGAPLINWLLFYSAEKLARAWTTAILVMNHEDFNSAQRLGYIEGKSLHLVPGVGIDIDSYNATKAFHSVKAELHIDKKSVVVSCIGEIIPRKNYEFLLEGWETAKERLGDAHLLIVGEGPQLGVLEKKVKEFSLERVRFLGYRDDIPAILRDSDVVALVSKQEGLPRCIMEAMASGKPVVASRIRGNVDLVKHGETGYLVDLGDTTGLGRIIADLAEDSERRNRLGSEAKRRIEGYSLAKVRQQLAGIYKTYLN